MKLWGSWIFLASSPWYSQEAEEGSIEMKEEARMSLMVRLGKGGDDQGGSGSEMKLQELEVEVESPVGRDRIWVSLEEVFCLGASLH